MKKPGVTTDKFFDAVIENFPFYKSKWFFGRNFGFFYKNISLKDLEQFSKETGTSLNISKVQNIEALKSNEVSLEVVDKYIDFITKKTAVEHSLRVLKSDKRLQAVHFKYKNEELYVEDLKEVVDALLYDNISLENLQSFAKNTNTCLNLDESQIKDITAIKVNEISIEILEKYVDYLKMKTGMEHSFKLPSTNTNKRIRLVYPKYCKNISFKDLEKFSKKNNIFLDIDKSKIKNIKAIEFNEISIDIIDKYVNFLKKKTGVELSIKKQDTNIKVIKSKYTDNFYQKVLKEDDAFKNKIKESIEAIQNLEVSYNEELMRFLKKNRQASIGSKQYEIYEKLLMAELKMARWKYKQETGSSFIEFVKLSFKRYSAKTGYEKIIKYRKNSEFNEDTYTGVKSDPVLRKAVRKSLDLDIVFNEAKNIFLTKQKEAVTTSKKKRIGYRIIFLSMFKMFLLEKHENINININEIKSTNTATIPNLYKVKDDVFKELKKILVSKGFTSEHIFA